MTPTLWRRCSRPIIDVAFSLKHQTGLPESRYGRMQCHVNPYAKSMLLNQLDHPASHRPLCRSKPRWGVAIRHERAAPPTLVAISVLCAAKA
jgi:hypothetical protein